MNKRNATIKTNKFLVQRSWSRFGKRLIGRCSNCNQANTVLRRYENNRTWCDCCLTHDVSVIPFNNRDRQPSVSVRDLKARLAAIGLTWEDLHSKGDD